MVLGTNPNLGGMGRSAIGRWDNSACAIGVYMVDTFTVTVDVSTGEISCSMSDTFDVRCTITVPYITLNSLIDRAEVSRSIAHPYWTGTFHFDKTTTGGRTSNVFFNAAPVVFFMPDYTGKTNPVFCGVVPSESRKHTSWAGDETFTAYSFAWYLSKQYLPDIPNKRLYVNNLTCMPYLLSGSYDPSRQNVMYPDIYIHGLLGCNLNWYTSAFGDQEGIWYVDDGDEYWRRITNLDPTNVFTPTTHGDYTPPPWIPQNFSTTMTKQQAIDRLNEYYRYVFYDKWDADASGNYQPMAYWVPFVDVDGGSGLDLPTKADLTLNSTSAANLWNFLVGAIEVDQKGDEKFNSVVVRCPTSSGWVQSQEFGASVFHPIYNTGASAPYELPIEYYKENPDIASLADCSENVSDIYDYYSQQVITYRMTFKMRSDLELWQLIAVSGFNTSTYGEMEDGDYRIIDITYRMGNGGALNEVEVVLMLADSFASYQHLNRVYTNSILEMQGLIRDATSMKEQKQYGTVIYGTIGAGGIFVAITLNSAAATTIQVMKTAYYSGAATISSGDKVTLTMSSDGTLLANRT
jgi:hypothetical protein